jgi:hypothetical protein
MRPPYARDVFFPGGDYQIPKPSFLYFVHFNSVIGADHIRAGHLAYQAGRPGFQLNYRVLNQYNRKRVVHTGIEYDPVQIVFYDTTDEASLSLIANYLTYHYNDFGVGDSVFDQYRSQDNTSKWGIRAGQSADVQNYFTSIDIYEFYGTRGTLTKMFNPKIIQVSFSENDMTANDGQKTITINVLPESVVYETIGGEPNAGPSEYGEYPANNFNVSGSNFFNEPTPFSNLSSFSNVFRGVSPATFSSQGSIRDAFFRALKSSQAGPFSDVLSRSSQPFFGDAPRLSPTQFSTKLTSMFGFSGLKGFSV